MVMRDSKQRMGEMARLLRESEGRVQKGVKKRKKVDRWFMYSTMIDCRCVLQSLGFIGFGAAI